MSILMCLRHCTFPLIGEANENTYVTITDNRT